jgi:phage/plasmid-like protein (TIGR03299 family)
MIDFTKETAAIAFTGKKPWHGYGQCMPSGQPLEVWLRQAGMDYEVIARPLAYVSNRVIEKDGSVVSDTSTEMLHQLQLQNKFDVPKYSPLSGKRVLTRDDTGDILSIVTDRYNVVQPKEVMEFFRDLISDMGFEMHTAGVLADGKRVWALAKTGKGFSINGDIVDGYLLLATSYDGKFSTTAQFTSIRVVCWNTLSWSLDMGEDTKAGVVRIPHTAEFDPKAVKEELGLLNDLGNSGFKNFEENVIKLADYKVSKRQAVDFFLELLGVDEEASGRQLQTTKKLLAFYESGPGAQLASSHNTTWGLVNAVSFLTDHARRGRTDRRFNSAAFGEGAKLKAKAFEKALELAEAA